MSSYFDQDEYNIRCEWNLEGISLLAPTSQAIIIVDVISFSSAVDIAVSRGGQVYPFPWRDARSVDFAQSVGATLANSSRNDSTGYSLAPTSMLKLSPGTKIVLPSPNGSMLSLATGDTPTFTGCLRNASAVAAAAASLGQRITVIPAGERWLDGSLRPALEDLLGAGAIIHSLPGRRSPEAEAALGVFLHFRDRLWETLSTTGSGKEAIDRGNIDDIHLAAQLDASSAAPRLVDGRYQ